MRIKEKINNWKSEHSTLSKISKPFRKLKEFVQRGKRGFADSDLISMNEYLIGNLPKMLKAFEKNAHGEPLSNFEEVDNFDPNWRDQQYKEILEIMKNNIFYKNASEERWAEYTLEHRHIRWMLVIRRIAFCFEESYNPTCSQTNEFRNEYRKRFHSGEPAETEHEILEDNEVEILYEMREDELQNYRDKMHNEAFDLLKKYFHTLWL